MSHLYEVKDKTHQENKLFIISFIHFYLQNIYKTSFICQDCCGYRKYTGEKIVEKLTFMKVYGFVCVIAN